MRKQGVMKKKCLKGTLAIDLPFQTLAVDSSSDRLALQLYAPEMLSSLSKSRISLFNAHVALFVQRMTKLWSQNHIGKYRHFVN